MEKEKIAELVATAVSSALAQIVPVIQTLGMKVEELEAGKAKTEEQLQKEKDEEAHQEFAMQLKESQKQRYPSKENGFNIQEI